MIPWKMIGYVFFWGSPSAHCPSQLPSTRSSRENRFFAAFVVVIEICSLPSWLFDSSLEAT